MHSSSAWTLQHFHFHFQLICAITIAHREVQRSQWTHLHCVQQSLSLALCIAAFRFLNLQLEQRSPAFTAHSSSAFAAVQWTTTASTFTFTWTVHFPERRNIQQIFGACCSALQSWNMHFHWALQYRILHLLLLLQCRNNGIMSHVYALCSFESPSHQIRNAHGIVLTLKSSAAIRTFTFTEHCSTERWIHFHLYNVTTTSHCSFESCSLHGILQSK